VNRAPAGGARPAVLVSPGSRTRAPPTLESASNNRTRPSAQRGVGAGGAGGKPDPRPRWMGAAQRPA